MISFELKGDSKIVEEGVFLPNIIGYQDIGGFMKKLNLKVYLNEKRLRKKIIIENNCWRFVKPLKLTKDDVLTYTWTV
jgi:hypothetical protein